MKRYSADPRIRVTAMNIVRGINERDRAGEAAALFAFVRDKIKYMPDVLDVETLQTPDKTLELGAGDCDDQVTLLNSLARSIGFETRFVTMESFPGVGWDHVYSEIAVGDRWIGADPINRVPLGAIPGRAARREVYSYD